MSTASTADTAGDLVMKTVIICEDSAFATEASALLQRVGASTDVRIVWEVKWWSLKTLTESESAGKALVESLDAHLILLPASYALSVPAKLLCWLKRWAEARQTCDAALGFIGETSRGNLPQPVSLELAVFIRQYGVHLIVGQGLIPEATGVVAGTARGLRMSASVVPASFETPPPHQSYRGMGINE